MEAVLKIENLTKYFGKKKILDDISFEVNAGEVLGFLGPNGAGKTTTIKIVMGFLQKDSGSVTVCGYNLKNHYEKAMANLGGIVENPEMYKELSGLKNLQMYAKLHEGVTDERINEVVTLVGLQNRIKNKVKSYSLGMKQRLGLAQAMVHRPKMLILDEPTNGLDPVGIRELRDILKKLAHEENIAVMVSSHLLSEMELMCDRVAIINNGKILGVKTIKDIMEVSTGLSSCKFYTKEIARAKEILAKENYADKIKDSTEEFIEFAVEEDEIPKINILLAQQLIPITQIKKNESSLEDAFIDITGGGGVIA